MTRPLIERIRDEAAADRSGRDPFANARPLTFTPQQRRQLSDRVMLQKPPGEGQAEEFRALLRRRRTIEDIPTDVLFTLEAVRLLAEQGNRVAQELYWMERERLGIDVARRYFPAGR